MSPKSLPALEELRSLLSYDELTGAFTWKDLRGKRSAMAGSLTTNGYWAIVIKGKSYLAHRLAWLYHYGEPPKYTIDHINRLKTDNRISNLRDVQMSLNQQNQVEARKGSKTGTLGVNYEKRTGKYRARIVINAKEILLGRFEFQEEAEKAYLEAKSIIHEKGVLEP